METFLLIIAAIAGLILLAVFFLRPKSPVKSGPLAEKYKVLLNQHVEFYQKLDAEQKSNFESRVERFLSKIRINGVNTTVEDIDRAFIAAGAIIPIFGFANWEYVNLNEVLVYPGSFSQEFEQSGGERNTLGMVGNGPMQNVMILSQHELRKDFLNRSSNHNTAIHEFVHLVDKTDGSVDGIPEFILARKYALPWLELMRKEIGAIVRNSSDINPYGATNHAEFFAVVAEYFFERPDLLQSKHPDLYELLSTIFHQQPVIDK